MAKLTELDELGSRLKALQIVLRLARASIADVTFHPNEAAREEMACDMVEDLETKHAPGYREGWAAGQENMRERAAKEADEDWRQMLEPHLRRESIVKDIRALKIEEPDPIDPLRVRLDEIRKIPLDQLTDAQRAEKRQIYVQLYGVKSSEFGR